MRPSGALLLLLAAILGVGRSEVEQLVDATKCEHGSDGVLITLERSVRDSSPSTKTSVSQAARFAAKIKAQWRERRRSLANKDGTNRILFTYR